MLTKADRKRLSLIIAELCKLSRNGWRNARPVDYQPLEKEFHELVAKGRG